MINNDYDKWISYTGKKFFSDIGMKKDQFVIDFGCAHGTYSIPASLIVGKKGRVYAVDKNQESLNKLINKINEKELKNIEIIKVKDKLKIPLSEKSVDIVLLYDVLHLVENRKNLYNEINRILKHNGIVSVFPKHHQTYMNMTLEEVKDEIESIGFDFNGKSLKTLMHNDHLEKGYILFFKKQSYK